MIVVLGCALVLCGLVIIVLGIALIRGGKSMAERERRHERRQARRPK